MNDPDRKRHERRKARQRAAVAGSPLDDREPELRGTRMAVVPLDDDSQVRRLEIDATDPLDVVVRWGVRAMLEAAPDRVLRVVTVRNWDDDPRELYEIEESREYLRRLWADGKRLLRLLTESTGDCPDDDRLGVPPHVLRGLGFGWREVYTFGHCAVEREGDVVEADGVPSWVVSVRGLTEQKLDGLRAELLGITDDTPDGYTYDAARERVALTTAHAESIHAAAVRLAGDGHRDSVVLVLDLLDPIGRMIATTVGGNDQVREQLERCRADDLRPGAVIAAPRESTVRLLQEFATGAAGELAVPAPPGLCWVVTVAAGGTQVGRVSVTEEIES